MVSSVFETSKLKLEIEERYEGKYVVAGDEAYRLSSTIMTPYRKTPEMEEKKKNFNDAHKRARVVVENALGVLKMRFPCLLYESRCRIEHTQALIGILALVYERLS